MKQIHPKFLSIFRLSPRFLTIAVALLLAVPVFAQGNSPWENAVNVLQTAFTSTIARGLSLVAIVVAGLTFAFGEGDRNAFSPAFSSALAWPSPQ